MPSVKSIFAFGARGVRPRPWFMAGCAVPRLPSAAQHELATVLLFDSLYPRSGERVRESGSFLQRWWHQDAPPPSAAISALPQLILAALILFLSVPSILAQATNQPVPAPVHAVISGEFAPRMEALLKQMTVPEKIGQMVLLSSPDLLTGAPTGFIDLEDQIRSARCGNVFNAHTVAYVRKLQKIAVEQTRLGIPLLFGFDVIHGYQTVFPMPLGQASSWDVAAIERSARVAAVEATAGGLKWTFAPMVDIARDPRWGRIAEGAGEDPYLGSAIARALVRGFQGTNLADPASLLACVKHFAAYGAAQAGRDYNTVDISERTLREVYLPPYRAAIEEGALSIMTSFNEINGTPSTANRFLLQNILRDEWGFKGFVVTDYTSINELVRHGIAADLPAAGRAALNAGVDMDLQGSVYHDYLAQLLRSGDIRPEQIDEAVRRILTIKFALGLFDDPYRSLSEEREAKYGSYPPEHRKAAYDMACESLVLLKNDARLLPLKPGLRLAVIGPLADSPRDLLGSWNGVGKAERAASILSAIRSAAGAGSVTFAAGCTISTPDRSGFTEAIEAARNADTVVMVLGESWDMTGEAASRLSINLPGIQTGLLREIKQLGKPVVLVLLNGRPLALEEESSLTGAILEAWFPGTEGGLAVADTLFGRNNPSGRLPVTFPRSLGQVPIYYSVKNTGRPYNAANPNEKYVSKYLDGPNTPLYPFGFGLSYTDFAFSNIQLDTKALHPGEKLRATVEVTNTGTADGIETVQMYIRDLVADVTRPVLELKGFQRVDLTPGQRQTVTFEIEEKTLTFLRADMTFGTEPGQYEVLVGPNSAALKSAQFDLTAH